MYRRMVGTFDRKISIVVKLRKASYGVETLRLDFVSSINISSKTADPFFHRTLLNDPQWLIKLSKVADLQEWKLITKKCGLSLGVEKCNKLNIANSFCKAFEYSYIKPPLTYTPSYDEGEEIRLEKEQEWKTVSDFDKWISQSIHTPNLLLLSIDPSRHSICHTILDAKGFIREWKKIPFPITISSTANLLQDPLNSAESNPETTVVQMDNLLHTSSILKNYFYQTIELIFENYPYYKGRHYFPAISLIILIEKQKFRGPGNFVNEHLLRAAFIEAQLYAHIMNHPFYLSGQCLIQEIDSLKVASYFELPFGQDKRRISRDLLQNRTHIYESSAFDLNENKNNQSSTYDLKNMESRASTTSLTLPTDLKPKTLLEEDTLSSCLLQALAWLEWRKNLGVWMSILIKRTQWISLDGSQQFINEDGNSSYQMEDKKKQLIGTEEYLNLSISKSRLLHGIQTLIKTDSNNLAAEKSKKNVKNDAGKKKEK